MTSPSSTRTILQAHDPWRVILVGRTGLDQTLRRDAQIELIRCRDSIEAIGELSDPIDHETPSQSIVIVSADAIEDDPQAHKQFINALRLIDPGVCVLRIARNSGAFDGCVQQSHSLSEICAVISECLDQSHPQPMTLRFIDANAFDQQPGEPRVEPDPVATPEPDPTPEPDSEPTPASQPAHPEVTVVVENETFEHRAQVPFDQEDELHQHIILGASEQPSPSRAQPHTPPGPIVHDDEPVVMALLRGRPIIEPAIAQINMRLGRSDIELMQPDATGASLGVAVVVGDRAVGILSCDDHRWLNGLGRPLLARHAQWLASWIRLEAQQSELRRCAFTDTLTGAWNRRYFDRFLSAAIDQSRVARRSLTIMIFDIDSFKHYNDTYGHGAGDEILIETVKLLKSVIRPSDRVCRVGGDEFAVIFYEPEGPRDPSSKPLESIYQIACRFQKQICTHRFPKLGHEAMGNLTVSGGLASYPWDGHDAASLLEQADQYAMESKRQGKNAITLGPGAESVCHTEH